jgi:hypothetical protein
MHFGDRWAIHWAIAVAAATVFGAAAAVAVAVADAAVADAAVAVAVAPAATVAHAATVAPAATVVRTARRADDERARPRTEQAGQQLRKHDPRNLRFRQTRTRRNLEVREPVGAQQRNPSSTDVTGQSVPLSPDPLQLPPLRRREHDRLSFAHAA